MFKEILLLNPIYVTLFWAVALSIHNRQNHLPKVFLGWFMMFASVVYISHFFYFTQNYEIYTKIDALYTLAYLMVYPMYYVYVRLLTVDSFLSYKHHFRYFAAPALIFVMVLVGYIILGKEGGKNFIEVVLVNGEKPQGTEVYMFALFVFGRVVFLIQTGLYLYLSFKLIRAHNERLTNYYSNMEERKLNWVQFFNFSLALTSISSGILAGLGRNVFLQNEWLLVFPSIVFTAMLFSIGLLGFNQRAVLTEIASAPETIDEGKTPTFLKTKLDDLFESEKIFKNPDLKIWDLSSMLGTNRTYVSRVINSEYGRNFCSHVNHYRINNVKQLARQNKNLTNEQIAELSGFGSVNTLYRVFQASEGISLGQYRKNTDSQ